MYACVRRSEMKDQFKIIFVQLHSTAKALSSFKNKNNKQIHKNGDKIFTKMYAHTQNQKSKPVRLSFSNFRKDIFKMLWEKNLQD